MFCYCPDWNENSIIWICILRSIQFDAKICKFVSVETFTLYEAHLSSVCGLLRSQEPGVCYSIYDSDARGVLFQRNSRSFVGKTEETSEGLAHHECICVDIYAIVMTIDVEKVFLTFKADKRIKNWFISELVEQSTSWQDKLTVTYLLTTFTAA